MNIKKVLNPDEFDCGVIVARFQVDSLHQQQEKLIEYVFSNHQKVIIFLGVAKSQSTRRNPLDFATRKAMIQSLYPSAIILPLSDIRSDIDWAKSLDSKISEVFPNSKPLLYGSRGSFIQYYKGRYTTIELISTDVEVSGSQVRDRISREIINSPDFRAGVIHSIYSRYPMTYPTVDVCAYNDDGQILLAKKPNEDKFRFIGGFVDPTDISLDRAAYREFMEEVNGCHISNMRYILSQKVDDWRYNNEVDGIMTTLFLGRFGHGQVKASDDISEVKWFDVKDLKDSKFIERNIMPEHVDMMGKLIKEVYDNKLIPNI